MSISSINLSDQTFRESQNYIDISDNILDVDKEEYKSI